MAIGMGMKKGMGMGLKKGMGKVAKVMGEFKANTLRSSAGPKVRNPKQAIAIGLSEARSAGARISKKAKGTLESRLQGKKF